MNRLPRTANDSEMAIEQHDVSGNRRFTQVLIGAIAFSLAASLALSFAFPREQTFAAYGLVKTVTLPAVYLFTFLAMTVPSESPLRVRCPPLWWWLSVTAFVTTIAWSMGDASDASPMAFVQDVLLLGGFLLLFLFGSTAPLMRDQDKAVVGLVICVAGSASVLLGGGVGPFSALVGPALAGLLYWSRLARRNRGFLIFWAILAVGAFALITWQSHNPSTAMLSSVGICVGILVVSLIPRSLRRPALLLGAVAVVAFLKQDGTLDLMAGRYRGVDDVTLAQRGCEARVVFRMVFGPTLEPPTLEPLLGLGPGGTVDLTTCPDVATLRAAGRDLRAVDDVHLATSWVLMKQGLLGWIWLAAFSGFVGMLAWRLVGRDRPAFLDVLMLMCAAAGIVDALPAATNLFSNPLVAMSLGVLWRRDAVRQTHDSVVSH